MLILNDAQIRSSNISLQEADSLVRKAFLTKSEAILPPKISLHIHESGFMNTMPAVIPELNLMGVKIITRFPGRNPSVDGDILLYDYTTGNSKALMNAFYITTLRTGAVAALAMKTFAVPNYRRIALTGMGNVGKAVMESVIVNYADSPLEIAILEYKDRFNDFVAGLPKNPNVSFVRCRSMKELVTDSDVVFSCITNAEGILAEPEWFKPGVTLIPVHTKGFQTCDLVFDRIFADDTGHVCHFGNFSKFRYFNELSEVLKGRDPGRRSDSERIISYNIGLALHDIIFADRVLKNFENK